MIARSYRWTLVAIGALMTCIAAGAVFCLAVFLDPLTAATGWSRAGVSTAMTIDFLLMGAGGVVWGALSDRFGPRPVLVSGSLLLGTGLVLAAPAPTLLLFQIAYGVLVGFGVGAFFAPLMALVTRWFDAHRALAVSLVSAGLGVAPMTMSPLSGWLISTHDWRTSMATIGVLCWVVLLPCALALRSPPDEPVPARVPDGSRPVVTTDLWTAGSLKKSSGADSLELPVIRGLGEVANAGSEGARSAGVVHDGISPSACSRRLHPCPSRPRAGLVVAAR